VARSAARSRSRQTLRAGAARRWWCSFCPLRKSGRTLRPRIAHTVVGTDGAARDRNRPDAAAYILRAGLPRESRRELHRECEWLRPRNASTTGRTGNRTPGQKPPQNWQVRCRFECRAENAAGANDKTHRCRRPDGAEGSEPGLRASTRGRGGAGRRFSLRVWRMSSFLFCRGGRSNLAAARRIWFPARAAAVGGIPRDQGRSQPAGVICW
jgi:hypothetical protein